MRICRKLANAPCLQGSRTFRLRSPTCSYDLACVARYANRARAQRFASSQYAEMPQSHLGVGDRKMMSKPPRSRGSSPWSAPGRLAISRKLSADAVKAENAVSWGRFAILERVVPIRGSAILGPQPSPEGPRLQNGRGRPDSASQRPDGIATPEQNP